MATEETDKLLDDCKKRMMEIATIIHKNSSGEGGFEDLLETAKKMDELKNKFQKEQKALNKCTLSASESQEPWNINIKQIYEEEIAKLNTEKSKNKIYSSLKKHIDKQDEDVMEVDEVATQTNDPWTRLPIQTPVQSSTCKHLYDQRSINCIIKNRPHFKCPYIGCQNVVTKEQLIYLNDD